MHEPSGSTPAKHTPSPSAEADFTQLFNLSLDLLCVAGLDGYFKRVNPSWTRVLGWSEAELLARPVADFMHPEDRERTLGARAGLARGTPVRGLENRYLCKDGSCRWLSWQSVTEPGSSTVFAVARDVTERRQLDYEQLVMSKLESTGILAGGMAHDFNNLLTGVALSLEMVALSGATTPDQAHYLEQAQQSVNAAKSLTTQLIALTNGGISTREIIDLKKLLPQALDFILAGSGIRGECRVAPDLWRIEGDEAQIAQAIRSLILNAREATPVGGTVRLQAENGSQGSMSRHGVAPGHWVRISVADDGVGIAPEILPQVFDPYFSTKQRGTQKGMGLGLTICRTVIRKHGGSIAIDSRSNRGTTVTCHLPAVPHE
jgi:two-component system, cell cycle sensor histidine kinase and response regulator CckA